MGVGAASAVVMLLAVAIVVVPYIRSEIRQARRSS
jgi:ABC-type sugar transport system permease subunit